MRRVILTALALLAALQVANGQIAGLTIDIHGGYKLVVDIGGGSFVTVSDRGEIYDIDTRSPVTYYNSIFDYLDGRVKSVGRTNFDYYDSIFAYQHGKLKRLGNLHFDYFDDFYPERAGKLKSVGNQRIEYYDVFSPDDSKMGLPKTIGPLRLDFYGSRDFGPSADPRGVGLLKSIGPKRFTYSYPGNRRGGSSPVLNGQKNFEYGGIRITIDDGQRRRTDRR